MAEPTLPSLPALLTHRWRWVLVNGIVFAVLGALAILVPSVATLATELLVGWLLVLAGVSGLIFALTIRGSSGWWQTALVFALTLLLGLVFLIHPAAGIATLTILLIAVFALEGAASVVLALRYRSALPSWGWLLFSGIAALLVAAIILARWPESSLWAIGLLVGVNLLSTGISLIMMALGARRRFGGPF